jgi:chromosome segregation and condensation protein ScpB
VPLTRKNLEAIVGNPADPQVLKLIESNKLIKAVQLYNKGIN